MVHALLGVTVKLTYWTSLTRNECGQWTMVGNGSVFVTVGTTSFDALIEAVDSKGVQDAILEKGYTSLVVQIGRGKRAPREV